jgi:hypothetical protein
VRNGLNLKTKIVGVFAEEAPVYALSFAVGHSVAAPANTKLADGLACRVPYEALPAVIPENVGNPQQFAGIVPGTAVPGTDCGVPSGLLSC